MEKLLPENDSFAITIGRQFGSGGRELGKALARAFGIAYYDHITKKIASAPKIYASMGAFCGIKLKKSIIAA